MGIELDVLVGHPEHDLLFVATQVANAAGVKDGRGTAKAFIRAANRASHKVGLQIRELVNGEDSSLLTEAQCIEILPYPRWRDTWVMPETDVYQMLLRGNSPRSEPFRRWVTEEVLPTIRKTGMYNAEESSNPIAQNLIDQLRLLVRE
ncbi:Bro-N domain-containing protein [Pseudomonas marincola]|uniref:Bro-N domain-containing protein n=1 Tax=Pseudomonas marincola TaxID=437900 RepID=A0A653DXU6_9PSED|nr:BRO family protein [Pseudomonas marincola]CAE6931117.1 Bro-N domain-containing protein [Pseudomonas marincola]